MRVEWGDPARKLISLPKQPGAAHTPFARRDWLQAGLGVRERHALYIAAGTDLRDTVL